MPHSFLAVLVIANFIITITIASPSPHQTMQVVLRGSGLGVLVTAWYLINDCESTRVFIITERSKSAREEWVVSPVTRRSQLLQEAMFERYNSSVMFLEQVRRSSIGELIIRPGVQYSKYVMYEAGMLEKWLVKRLLKSHRLQFVQSLDPCWRKAILVTVASQSPKRAEYANVRFIGVHSGARLPQVVLINNPERLNIIQGSTVMNAQTDGQLASAMELAEWVKNIVDGQPMVSRL